MVQMSIYIWICVFSSSNNVLVKSKLSSGIPGFKFTAVHNFQQWSTGLSVVGFHFVVV